MKADDLVRTLFDCGIDFATGVPDSLQKDFCFAVSADDSRFNHISATNEGTAIGLAIGYNLATGKPSLVYMQNSGLGNALNPLVSLAHPQVYQIPMVLMIGWRGKPGTDDEPQHMTQGVITQGMLDLIQIPYLIVDSKTSLNEVGDFLTQKLSTPTGPLALLISEKTFESTAKVPNQVVSDLMTRERAVRIVTESTSDNTVFVSTTGKLSRELNEIRERAHEAGRDFLTVGGMGHASAIALGVALKTTDRCIVCLDGDGAALMHLGIMAMVGDLAPENFVHVVLNNGTHESVGAQPIAAKLVSFNQLAKSLHYKSVILLDSEQELSSFFLKIDEIAKPCLVEILINSESRSNLSRPSNSPKENKTEFTKFMGINTSRE